ncbi:hypothetical protein [Sphingomonas sp. S6]|jgi:hypothetical protein|uniref:hypothetical protein n=1 Tax=Sphingomonas sp. S6 TaxID=3368600 RepID=UPI000FA513D7|nr:MAG: hypothetical protein EKK50_09395 [Sphingomonadaceae bacterium]
MVICDEHSTKRCCNGRQRPVEYSGVYVAFIADIFPGVKLGAIIGVCGGSGGHIIIGITGVVMVDGQTGVHLAGVR